MRDDPNPTLDAARAWAAAGASIVPVATDGSKRPAGQWKHWQTQRADTAQIDAWLTGGWLHGWLCNEPLPREGVVVMQAERGGHTHNLHGEDCLYDPIETGLHIGTLTVPEGREALLTHQEHGALLIGAGTYRVGGQREYAGEWRRVAD
ncbi:hypothetical protein [Nakamurella aerolata]|uniref:Uncharacterized protein n=1 Tax=Nakamurella aerolata TaxID=1656892 RepID=A0A849A8N1_9ACTN|nr:hypothetical protein [Nakamurella aerolata]NNG36919.1 hypothetical protein [Nakamurella aerolata]